MAAALTLAAAVVVALVGIGILGGPKGPAVGPSLTPAPTPTASPSLTPSPAESPLEPLAPGTQTARSFWPPLTFTVPDGWLTERAAKGWLGLVPDTDENRAGIQDGGYPTALYVFLNFAVAAEDCEEAAAPGIGLTASDIVGALATRPGLTTGGPVPVTIGGLSGQQIDLSVAPDWTGTCPQVGTPFVPLVYSSDFVSWGAAPGERFRIIVLDVAGLPSGMHAAVMIFVYSAEEAAWDDHLSASMAVVESFEFDTTPPGPPLSTLRAACEYGPGCLPPEMRPPTTELVVGEEYRAAAGNYGFDFTVPATGWYARVNDPIGPASVTRITKQIAGKAVAEIIAWDPDRVYVDPCSRQLGPIISPDAADFASRLRSISGTDSSDPEELTPDGPGGFGFGASYMEIVVHEDADCAAADFHLWSDEVGHLRVPSALPSTLRVWVLDLSSDQHIVNVTGMRRMVIESELMNGAGSEVDHEIDQILDSLGFPG
ncbi:MAG TPA: hypothetical protein VHM29_03610, partial [Acidimicrobiia bacterium]|nr:hypothetical protein [Acidimicrobiia bacterium]